MHTSPRHISPTVLLRLAVCAAVAATFALVAPAARAAIDRGTQESLQAYEQQLAGHQITSATVNRRLHRVHVVLKDGSVFYAVFPMHGEAPIESGLRAAHVTYTVMSPAEAEQEANESSHKKKFARRYIAAIVVGVLLIIGIAVFLVRRRRSAMLDE